MNFLNMHSVALGPRGYVRQWRNLDAGIVRCASGAAMLRVQVRKASTVCLLLLCSRRALVDASDQGVHQVLAADDADHAAFAHDLQALGTKRLTRCVSIIRTTIVVGVGAESFRTFIMSQYAFSPTSCATTSFSTTSRTRQTRHQARIVKSALQPRKRSTRFAVCRGDPLRALLRRAACIDQVEGRIDEPDM